MKSRILICVTALLGFAALAVPMLLAAQDHHVKHHEYRLVDLGTFGGPNSTFNAGPIAKILNNQGQATSEAVDVYSDKSARRLHESKV